MTTVSFCRDRGLPLYRGSILGDRRAVDPEPDVHAPSLASQLRTLVQLWGMTDFDSRLPARERRDRGEETGVTAFERSDRVSGRLFT